MTLSILPLTFITQNGYDMLYQHKKIMPKTHLHVFSQQGYFHIKA